MSSKIIQILTLTSVLLVCPMLAMKSITIKLDKKSYELPGNIVKEIDFLSNVIELDQELNQKEEEEETEETDKSYGIATLLKKAKPPLLEDNFARHFELTKKVLIEELDLIFYKKFPI